MRTHSRALAVVVMLSAALAGAPSWAADEPGAEAGHGGHGGGGWQSWRAENEVSNRASLQRGARNFMAYCQGCHSLKYVRYSRLGEDLGIPQEQLDQFLLPPGAKPADYILTTMPYADAETWFGKAPPDLSLIARSRGVDYVYQFLKTFYADPAKPTGVNNLRLEGTAMPHVLSELQGVQQAVFKTVETHGEGGQAQSARVFEKFEPLVPGRLSEAEYDAFVRDTVNFLDYVGEPTQLKRKALGIWVVLFLGVFTWLAYLLKKEYWKDVH